MYYLLKYISYHCSVNFIFNTLTKKLILCFSSNQFRGTRRLCGVEL